MNQRQTNIQKIQATKPMKTGICLYDQANKICSWNQSAEEILGYRSAEILGKPVTFVFPIMDIMNIRGIYEVMTSNHQLIRLQTEKSELFLEDNRVVRVLSFSHQGPSFNRIIGDEEVYQKDVQSGLYDHRSIVALLDEATKIAMRRKQPLAVVVVEIDGYALIEEKHGTGSTELIVQTMAIILKNETRDVDCIGRLSESIFVVGLPSAGSKAAGHVAARINRVASRYSDDEMPFVINTAYTEVTGIKQDWYEHAVELLKASNNDITP